MPGDARRGRVLVIEDDAPLRETIAEVMTDDGHEVRRAANGREALATLASWPADVVILDMMMPVMDAHAFRREQRLSDAGGQAAVVLLSAIQNLDEAAQRLEADAWLAKPFTLASVSETVERLLAARAGTAAR